LIAAVLLLPPMAKRMSSRQFDELPLVTMGKGVTLSSDPMGILMLETIVETLTSNEHRNRE
jgi:hypothetical protein